MSEPTTNKQRERTQKVFDAIKKSVANKADVKFSAGDVSQTLRDGGFPLGSWEVRGEFSALQGVDMIALDEDSAQWHLTQAGVAASKLN